jgi:hypothetical protein
MRVRGDDRAGVGHHVEQELEQLISQVGGDFESVEGEGDPVFHQCLLLREVVASQESARLAYEIPTAPTAAHRFHVPRERCGPSVRSGSSARSA